jgi:hypothetical protein
MKHNDKGRYSGRPESPAAKVARIECELERIVAVVEKLTKRVAHIEELVLWGGSCETRE